MPAGLIDAEPFGNVANYPNAGMAERRGVIREADGSTLFLDSLFAVCSSADVQVVHCVEWIGCPR